MFFKGCENLAHDQPTLEPLILKLDAQLAAMGVAGEVVPDDLAYVLGAEAGVVEAILSELAECGTLAPEERVHCKNKCFAFTAEEVETALADGEELACPTCGARIRDDAQYRTTVYLLQDLASGTVPHTNIPDGRSLQAGPTYTLLFAASNPDVKAPLAIDNEWKHIHDRLAQKRCKVQIDKIDCWSASVGDLRRLLIDDKPSLVHFSGHGAHKSGLMFTDGIGTAKLVTGEALAELFRLCSHVECIVLSACYSAEQAGHIARHIHCVVGMSGEIDDEAAIAFSVGFYEAMTAGEPFGKCYEFGLNAIELDGFELTDIDHPVLWVDGEVYKSP